MPVPYQIITQQGPPGSGKEGVQISYARSFTKSKITTPQLVEMAALRSTLSSADMMGALYMIREVLRDELKDGKSVHLEGLGTFSIKASTGSLENPGRVRPEHFKTRRINFYPDASFRQDLRTLSFERQHK